jgi:hypothetical protein
MGRVMIDIPEEIVKTGELAMLDYKKFKTSLDFIKSKMSKEDWTELQEKHQIELYVTTITKREK